MVWVEKELKDPLIPTHCHGLGHISEPDCSDANSTWPWAVSGMRHPQTLWSWFFFFFFCLAPVPDDDDVFHTFITALNGICSLSSAAPSLTGSQSRCSSPISTPSTQHWAAQLPPFSQDFWHNHVCIQDTCVLEEVKFYSIFFHFPC